MSRLIVTNGDSAADLLRAAGLQGTILPWRDILHEGPITQLDLDASSRERTPFLAARFRIDAADIASTFAERDAIMHGHASFDDIELWFEHDLYDQLQLVQALAFLASVRRVDGVRLVQADDFLGTQRADTILRFADHARDVTTADLDLAGAVWSDLTAPTPEFVAGRSEMPSGALPFLRGALTRFLEELPAPEDGLGRTEGAILRGIRDEEAVTPARLFHLVLEQEEAVFMGDLSFFRLIEDLALCPVPLITGVPAPGVADEPGYLRDVELTLTTAGQDVLAGREDHVTLSGIERWWAGTHLDGRAVWRYDRGSRRLVAPNAGGG
jgi:hypothetical protein